MLSISWFSFVNWKFVPYRDDNRFLFEIPEQSDEVFGFDILQPSFNNEIQNPVRIKIKISNQRKNLLPNGLNFMGIFDPHQQKNNFWISLVTLPDKGVFALFVIYFGVNSFYLLVEGLRFDQPRSLSDPFRQLAEKLRLVNEITAMELWDELKKIFGLLTFLEKMKRVGPNSGEEGLDLQLIVGG